jgi:DNA-binding CsgD family transcriptional regulator
MSEVARVQQVAGASTGTVPGHDEPQPRVSSAPTAAKSHAADRVLLDAFLNVRSRTRGPLVAVNERTMITNLGASELLQPADRRLLWEHATKASGDAGESTTLVLGSGVEVTISAHLVGGQLSPKGAVMHLSVEFPARGTGLVGPDLGVGADESPGANRALDPSLMTGWTDLTDTERTVAELVARGMTNKQAGRLLFLSRHTVDYHLRRVFRKLGVNSRVELARALGEHYEALNGC